MVRYTVVKKKMIYVAVYLFLWILLLMVLTFIQITYGEDAERDTSFFTRSPKCQTEYAVGQIKWWRAFWIWAQRSSENFFRRPLGSNPSSPKPHNSLKISYNCRLFWFWYPYLKWHKKSNPSEVWMTFCLLNKKISNWPPRFGRHLKM